MLSTKRGDNVMARSGPVSRRALLAGTATSVLASCVPTTTTDSSELTELRAENERLRQLSATDACLPGVRLVLDDDQPRAARNDQAVVLTAYYPSPEHSEHAKSRNPLDPPSPPASRLTLESKP